MFRIYLKKREKSEKERILSGALLPKHSQKPGLGDADTGSPKLCVSHIGERDINLNHHLLPQRMHTGRKLDSNQSSWD